MHNQHTTDRWLPIGFVSVENSNILPLSTSLPQVVPRCMSRVLCVIVQGRARSLKAFWVWPLGYYSLIPPDPKPTLFLGGCWSFSQLAQSLSLFLADLGLHGFHRPKYPTSLKVQGPTTASLAKSFDPTWENSQSRPAGPPSSVDPTWELGIR